MENSMRLKFITRCMAIAICTKNTNWDNEEYMNGVIKPYKRIQKMAESLEIEGGEPTVQQMKDALDMLKSVFATKKTSVEEQRERIEQVFNETGLHDLFGDLQPQ
ncbi:MAG TPA: hypothetical protein VF941_02070 [Clostridia bacterium]